MVDAGVRLALGSDSPVTPMDPWQAVKYAVSHHNEDQRLTVAEAFEAHTRGGYELAGRDGGTLTPGRASSYVVWDQDDDLPRTRDGLPDLAADPQSPLPTARLTVVDGHVTFDRQGEQT